MNRSIDSPGVAGTATSATTNPVAILLLARQDKHLDQLIKLVSARDNFRLVARVDPEVDWHTRLPDQGVDIVLLQQSLVAPARPLSHTPLAETGLVFIKGLDMPDRRYQDIQMLL